MKKKILKFLKWLLLSLLVIFIGIFTYFFKEIKTLDSMLRPEDKPFGSGLLQANKYSRLMSAIWQEDQDRIDYLIKEKGYNPAKIRIYSKYGSSNLMQIYILGSGLKANADFVEFLISRGFSADDCEQGLSSPIYAAVLHGNQEIVEILLKHGAKVNCLIDDKAAPLTLALQGRYCKLVKYLVEKGASLDGIHAKEGFERILKECSNPAGEV